MYARVMTALVQPGKMDEAVSIYRHAVVPAAQAQNGYQGGFFLTDPSSGRCISISLWETEADMLGGEASGYLQEQVAKVAPTLTAPPDREAYEVSVKA